MQLEGEEVTYVTQTLQTLHNRDEGDGLQLEGEEEELPRLEVGG